MTQKFNSFLSLTPQVKTSESWFNNPKTTLRDTSILKNKLSANIVKPKYQEYKFRLSKKAITIPKNSTHSILSRFHTEFQKTLSSTMKEEKTNIVERMSSIKTNLKRNSLNRSVKPQSKGFISTNTLKTEETLPINNEPLTNSMMSSGKESSVDDSPPTYLEPSNVVSKARLRTYDIKYNDKWKDKIGFGIQDIQYTKLIIKDMSFQHNYIKDEMRIIFENCQHYKQYFLSKKDLLVAFKNRPIRFQIAHNKTIEETISFLNKIPSLILKDFNQFTDNFIGVDNITSRDLRKMYITNEADCFIYNVRLLNRLLLFVKCCFEVYLTITKQVNRFVIKCEDFNYLRGLLEKIRYNSNEVIAVSKAILSDLDFERSLIEKYHPILLEDRKAQIKRTKLGDLIHQQFQFSKNEYSQKKKRMDSVLVESEDEDDTNKNKNKRRVKLRNGYGIIARPMELLVCL